MSVCGVGGKGKAGEKGVCGTCVHRGQISENRHKRMKASLTKNIKHGHQNGEEAHMLSSSTSFSLSSSLTQKGGRRLLLPGKDGKTARGRWEEDKRFAYNKEKEEKEEGRKVPGLPAPGGDEDGGCEGGNRRKSAHVLLS